MRIQLLIKILAVSVPQGKPHTKADDAIYARFPAIIQNCQNIFLRIIEKGKYRGQPHHCGNPRLLHFEEHLKASLGRADIRLHDSTQFLIRRGKRHLYHSLRPVIDLGKKRLVPQNQIRLGLNGCAEAVFRNQLQTPSRQAQLFFQMQIRVAHGARTNHAALPLFPQCLFQKHRRVLLHFNILKPMLHLIACASGITVDTAVTAPPVQIHSISCR